jgi:pilus assembly protein CpaB
LPPVTRLGRSNLKRSNRLVLLIGVFLAIVAFVGIALILNTGGPGSGAATPATTMSTVIATKDIPLGVAIKADMLKTVDRKIDTERKPEAFANPELVIGRTVRRPITNGAQIEEDDFVEGGGIRDLTVPAGMRAIAVSVDQISGVGTVIKTGDYVDMLIGLTGDKFPVVQLDPQSDTITVVQGLNSTSVKLLLQGMQVIGTLLPAPTTVAANPDASPGADQGQPATTLTEQSEIVILAVTAQQAEVIQFAKTDGLITLALRSPADFVDENGNAVISEAAGTTGVILKTLIDGGYDVIRPELVEAILPTQ